MASSIIGVNDTARNSTSKSPIASGLLAILGPDLDPNRVIEIRALGVGSARAIWSGTYYAHEIDTIVRDAQSLDGSCRGVYVTLNPLRTRRFAWSRSVCRLREARRTHKDADVLHRDNLMFDIDPVRAPGHEKDPATDGEQAAAFQVATSVVNDLASRGWPAPAIVSTGNGYQVTYHTEALPTDSDLVHRTLIALAARHATDAAKCDTTVANPSRIIRLPGLVNRKGTASADRPHRRSTLHQAGDGRRVTVAQIEAEAASVPPTPTPVRSVTPSTRISVSRSDADTTSLDRRVYAYLDRCPAAVEGAGGRSATFRVAGALVNGYALTEDDAFRFMVDSGWNDRCLPPWPEHQLRERIHAAVSGSRVGYRSLLDTELQPRDPATDDILKLFLPEQKPKLKPANGLTIGQQIDLEMSGGRVPDVRIANPTPQTTSDDVRDTGINTVDTRISNTPQTLTTSALLARLIGEPNCELHCSNPARRLAEGVSEETCGMDALFVIACGHWTCGCCRSRRRHHEKEQNVSVAFYHGTHTFTGTVAEWQATRMRLDRIRVEGRSVKIRRETYVVSQGGDQVAAIIAVAEADLHLVPEIPGLTPATGEAAATFVAEAIDRIPDFDPLSSKRTKIKRFRPSRNWNELIASTATDSPFGTVSASAEWSFVPGIVVGDHAEIARILTKHRQSYAADTMVNLPSGGAIEHTLVWRAAEPEQRYAIRRDVIHTPAEATPETDFALGITRAAKVEGEPDTEDAVRRLLSDWGSRA